MKEFFNLIPLEEAIDFSRVFKPAGREHIATTQARGRIAAQDITAGEDLPGFTRSTMDGYAICASSSFGASDSSPAWLTVAGSVAMGAVPDFTIGPGEAAAIATGAMVPSGADSVVMVEYTEAIDDETIEVYKSVAPGANIVRSDEDFSATDIILKQGVRIAPQHAGLLGALGIQHIEVFNKPIVGIISTGDEVVPIDQKPVPGQIRDVNAITLAAMVEQSGGIPIQYGIVDDNASRLFQTVVKAHQECDMVLVSGGSSVGTRDYTLAVFSRLDEAQILFQGVSVSPGKPTILCNAQSKPVFGIPGHVTSAMVVFDVLVTPFLARLCGADEDETYRHHCPAVLTRNIASAQGRTDFVRVALAWSGSQWHATPVLGKSGLINTMVRSHGLVRIPLNTEGLDKDTQVFVKLMR